MRRNTRVCIIRIIISITIQNIIVSDNLIIISGIINISIIDRGIIV